MFMNNSQVRDYAHNFAAKLAPHADKSLAAAVAQGYRTAIARPPDETELQTAIAFIQSQQASYAADQKPNARELALADFCQVLFGLNEFVYVE
jgi:hypothetical protein